MQNFEKIYAEYFGEVYKFVLSLCQNVSLAEEITQETFFKALKNIDSFNGNSKLSSWLCQIAKNTLYSYLRKDKEKVIKEHLSSCESCKQNYEKMKGVDDIMKNNNSEDFKVAESLKNIRRKIFRNKIVVSILTIVVIAFAIFGVGTIMENIEKVIKYDNNIIVTKVNREDKGVCLEAEMTGNLMISTTQKRVEIEKNGEKEINIYFYSETNAWEDFLANEKTTSRYFIAPINEDNDIDNVYYYTGDYSNLEEMSADELDKINQSATLLWSK